MAEAVLYTRACAVFALFLPDDLLLPVLTSVFVQPLVGRLQRVELLSREGQQQHVVVCMTMLSNQL